MRKKFYFKAAGGSGRCLGILLLSFALVGAMEIKPPSGWVPSSVSLPGVVLQFVSPGTAQGFNSNLVVSRGKLPCCKEEETPLDSLVTKVNAQQARMLPLFKVNEQSRTTIQGQKGAVLVSGYALGPVDVMCLQFFFLQDEDFVNVVFSAPSKEFGKLRPEFEKSLLTFRPADKKGSGPP